jgi:hypothetical protein
MKRSRALPTIASAGLIAGILDITSAFVIAGIKGTGSIRMLQGIASGLLGQRSFEGGMATAGLGLTTHFLIAFTAAAVFYAASRADTARRCLGIALRNRGLHFHVLDGRAARVPERAPFHVERRHRCDHSHCFDRAADRAGGPPFFERTIG